MKRFVTAIGALVLACSLGAGQASANIMYTFTGVTFSDAGTLSGTFTTNDAITSLVTYNITTSAGAGGLGFTYTPATSISTSTSLPSIIVVSTASLDHLLQVTFNGGLKAAGASILIGQFDSFEQGTTGVHRTITAGAATVATTAVPEPWTVSMAGLGLLGLFFLRRQRTY